MLNDLTSREVHDAVCEDTGFTCSSKRPSTGDPNLSPTAGIGPAGVGLGVASWERETTLIFVFEFVAHLVMTSVALVGYLKLYRVRLQQQLIWIHIS